ncbi:MAG TPA: ACT domain-containing protein [Acidimicrobiales bacterium]|nr:ACT domain-containing protein [Acidimicrobiales bacterium]
MPRFSLHAIGTDRPGIVAGVTGVLAKAGCNLEDSRMAILHGQFAIMLIVEAPLLLSLEQLEESFREVQEKLDLLIVLRLLPEHPTTKEPGDTIAVSVHGADRPGIVSLIATRVAELGGNIIDLATHRMEEHDGASYVLLLSIETSPACTEEILSRELDIVARQLGVSCVVHAGGNELF